MTKVFSVALRNRLNAWCENDNLLTDVQFGFRNSKSTSNCVFILYNIIQKILADKQNLYCAFIDYEKAFDTINHGALSYKLIDVGISSKMHNILKSLYKKVSSCIKANSNISDFFEISLGLKQGEPLSPLLFILFVNDVSSNLDFNSLTENDLNQLCIFMILFADDMVIFTTDPKSLQCQLDSLYLYAVKWVLKINISKT